MLDHKHDIDIAEYLRETLKMLEDDRKTPRKSKPDFVGCLYIFATLASTAVVLIILLVILLR